MLIFSVFLFSFNVCPEGQNCKRHLIHVHVQETPHGTSCTPHDTGCALRQPGAATAIQSSAPSSCSHCSTIISHYDLCYFSSPQGQACHSTSVLVLLLEICSPLYYSVLYSAHCQAATRTVPPPGPFCMHHKSRIPCGTMLSSGQFWPPASRRGGAHVFFPFWQPHHIGQHLSQAITSWVRCEGSSEVAGEQGRLPCVCSKGVKHLNTASTPRHPRFSWRIIQPTADTHSPQLSSIDTYDGTTLAPQQAHTFCLDFCQRRVLPSPVDKTQPQTRLIPRRRQPFELRGSIVSSCAMQHEALR